MTYAERFRTRRNDKQFVCIPLRNFQVSAVARRVKNFRLFEPAAGEFLKFPEDGSANRPGRFIGCPSFGYVAWSKQER